MEERLDLSSLRKVVDSLDEALAEQARNPDNELVRDACIQRFERCYAQTKKMIKLHLAMTGPDPGAVERMALEDRIRQAHAAGLLRNSWDDWWQYREDRAATSHGYDEKKAGAILDNLPGFAAEVRYLLDRLAVHEAGL